MIDIVLQSPALTEQAVAAFADLAGTQPRVRTAQLARFSPERVPAAEPILRRKADRLGCDVAIVPRGMQLCDLKVLASDMDSTLVAIETLDQMAAYLGKGEEVARITEMAMRGEIANYAESLERRCRVLAGAPVSVMDRLLEEKLVFNPGAEKLVAAARAAGLKTLLVSGGFDYVCSRVARRLGMDGYACNHLEEKDGILTGRVTGMDGAPIQDALGKARALRAFCEQHGFAPSQAITFGDGSNDLRMMATSAVSVAYRGKPRTQAAAQHALNVMGLDSVLNWFD